MFCRVVHNRVVPFWLRQPDLETKGQMVRFASSLFDIFQNNFLPSMLRSDTISNRRQAAANLLLLGMKLPCRDIYFVSPTFIFYTFFGLYNHSSQAQ